MSKKTILTILNYLFSYVGVAAIVVVDFIVPTNSWGYKLSLAGIVFIIAFAMVAKAKFVRSFQDKMNELLEALATAMTEEEKQVQKKKLASLKMKKAIVDKVDTLFPLIILCFATSWAGAWLQEMSGVIGLCLLSMGIGAGFDIWKRSV